jgi:hypothetical protein
MLRPEMAVALAMSMSAPLECPTCGHPAEIGKIHRKCLLKRHGGTLPDGFDELITAFKLDEDGEFDPDTED